MMREHSGVVAVALRCVAVSGLAVCHEIKHVLEWTSVSR
jgi:hypothetical protein